MAFIIHLSFSFLTMIGLLFGHLFRVEHSLKPFDDSTLLGWVIVSLGGLLFTKFTSLFYFMNMVTIGWMSCDYTLQTLNFRT
jgi:hypothetical protein